MKDFRKLLWSTRKFFNNKFISKTLLRIFVGSCSNSSSKEDRETNDWNQVGTYRKFYSPSDQSYPRRSQTVNYATPFQYTLYSFRFVNCYAPKNVHAVNDPLLFEVLHGVSSAFQKIVKCGAIEVIIHLTQPARNICSMILSRIMWLQTYGCFVEYSSVVLSSQAMRRHWSSYG